MSHFDNTSYVVESKNSEIEDQEDVARKYYDSDEAQIFYTQVFGDNGMIHNGRHDIINADPATADLPVAEKERCAMLLFEDELIEFVKKNVGVERMSIMDLGCGFNAVLRRFVKSGGIKHACGIDLSSVMTTRSDDLDAEFMNKENIRDCKLETRTESFIRTSVESESMDCVMSMDALLHVGPDMHGECLKEAFRVLKPGGWVTFCDIMQRPDVDPVVMKPIYERLNLSSLGTVENYHQKGKELGFINQGFIDHSSNIAPHYSNVQKCLIERTSPGSPNKIPLSQGFTERMTRGLQHWVELAPENMKWGIVSMQKPPL